MIFRTCKPACLLVCLTFPLLLSGCWDSHDINLRTMPVIIGIGKGESQAYNVTLQIPIPAEDTFSIKTVSQESSSIGLAFDNMKINIENYIDLLDIEMVVFHESVAHEGLEEEFNNAVRTRGIPPRSLVAITDANMKELFTNTNKAIKSDVTTFLKFSNKAAGWTPKTAKTKMWEAYESTKSYTQDVIIPIIRPGKETVLNFPGSAVMREGKMVARIGQEETMFANVVTNRFHGAAIEVLKSANLMILNAKMKWKARLTQDGPTLDGTLYVKAALTESREDASEEELTAEMEKYMTDQLYRLTAKLQRFKSDPLGFGNHFRNKLQLEELKRWRTDYYPKLKVNYKVKVVINNFGNLEREE
ncbi:Ger(x)C family spore germination protein [Paenibacillus sp. CF384]|uniref:Ger(x)C family spore germination protein n=1 Tax=Paenibacillus sp. CF384 TaxID=1884382 RepID=UPI00089AB403|nr:Ger(x)C family spore germination protein [Paenibacillus sp. CF384]SDW80116.1 germination protein, Ger(x)C family [Paenibacillus sp. CF384]